MKTLDILLNNYIKENKYDTNAIKMLNFYKNNKNCFSKDNTKGHFTGSAWIISPAKDAVLMTHHKKLNMWLQLGGHADGDNNLINVALRESEEESGFSNFKLLSEKIFDLDIHEIEPMNDDPRHLHYDVRFLLEADPIKSEIIVSDESHDVKWIPISKVKNYNSEDSIKRMVDKTIRL
jgi:8-oxo-dGTP pyrophosphatase MutT (NUDIX family)